MKQRAIKIAIFVIVLICINSILSFVLIPTGGASEVMWNDYYKMEDLDTVYIGSSVCLCSFNPYILDEELGTNSYNMGTPSQPIDLTYLALETALKEHHIKRVYFGFGYFALTTTNSRQAETAFLQARNQYLPFEKRILTNIGYMFEKKNVGNSTSINFMFPWVYNHVNLHAGDLISNISDKMKGKTVSDAKQAGAEHRTYVGRGYGYYDEIFDYDTADDLNSAVCYYGEFIDDSLGMLNKICKMCEENGVELIIINTPRPTFDVLSYGEEYYTKYVQLKTFLNECGAEYYDFNLIKPEIYESQPDYYYNFEHLNKKGVDVFCRSLANFERIRWQGTDMENYFYDWDEYLASINNLK